MNLLLSMNSRFILLISMMFSSPSPATPTHRKGMYDEHSFLCPARFGDHAAARCPALAAQPPDDTNKWSAGADRHAGAVRLRVRWRDWCRPGPRGARRRLYRLNRARDHHHERGQWGSD